MSGDVNGADTDLAKALSVALLTAMSEAIGQHARGPVGVHEMLAAAGTVVECVFTMIPDDTMKMVHLRAFKATLDERIAEMIPPNDTVLQ